MQEFSLFFALEMSRRMKQPWIYSREIYRDKKQDPLILIHTYQMDQCLINKKNIVK